MFTEKEIKQRDEIVSHILRMKEKDIELARHALRWYHNNQPHLNIKELIKERMEYDPHDQIRN
jgi:hypothetical protein